MWDPRLSSTCKHAVYMPQTARPYSMRLQEHDTRE